MALSKCPGCKYSSFELVEQANIAGARYKFMFVQCASCGTVVGVVDYEHVPTLIHKLTALVTSIIARIR